MIPVVVLGAPAAPPLLGLPLDRHLAIAASRAGLILVDALPASGDVIVVDADAAVSWRALTTLAGARRGATALVDADDLIARADVATVRGASSIHALVAAIASAGPTAHIERVDLPVARYRDGRDRRRAEDVLARAACKTLLAGDHLGALNRELTLPLVKRVAPTGIRPNTITLIGFAFTLAAAVPLAAGGYPGLLLGAFLQWLGSLLDGVDGKLARLKGQTSVGGARLDSWLDMVYYAVLFGALGVGLARDHDPVLVAALAAITLTGMAASFVVIAGMKRKLVPRDRPDQFGPLVYRLLDTYRGDPAIGFARATIRITTRAGMPHIFLALALIGGLPVGIALAALAAHLVWMLALRLERLALDGPAAARRAAPAVVFDGDL